MLSRSSLAVVLALAVPVSAWAAAPAESGKSFPAGGVSLYYELLGSSTGTPLVVVNGGPGFDHSSLHIANPGNELAKHRTVVFYDQRDTGRSPLLATNKGNEGTAGLAEQIADLEALRQHLGAEKI